MRNNTTIFDIFETLLTKEEVNTVCEALGYKDTSRKFTVYDLFQFFIAAATNEYKSFRTGSDLMNEVGLKAVDYSTISKKAAKVDYKIAKKLFEILITKCNRSTRRVLRLPKDLLAVDSTTITVGEGRLKWAKFKGEKSGIKLHVALNVTTLMPQKAIETTAIKHDGPIGEELVNTDCILVEDRAYGKHKRYDMFKSIKQNLNVKKLFGTSENAVYNQLFIALIGYVLLHFSYVNISEKLKFFKLSFCQFIRKLLKSTLQDEVQVIIDLLLKNINNYQLGLW